MKNITVTVDDETYRAARVKAAEQDTSISAVVKQFLAAFASGQGEHARLAESERALRERIDSFRAADRLPRDDVHDRAR